MREVLGQVRGWQERGEDVALATLVRVRGSTPQRPGARMWVSRHGKVAGSVSGGCVDNDVIEHAMRVLDRSRPMVCDYGISDELTGGVGLSCGGSIEVLIEPLRWADTWQAITRALEAGEGALLALALSPEQVLGGQLVLLPDGSCLGSIDPLLDETVAREGRRLLDEESGGVRMLHLPFGGREAELFLQAFAPAARLFIIGATHTAVALCRIAKVLGFHVTVVDPRRTFANRERFAEADEIVEAWPGEVLSSAGLDSRACVVTLSHDTKLDIPAVAKALRSRARYIGALGSRATHESRKAALREEGFEEADIERVRAPVGLDLGGGKPEEIALAIMAEIVALSHECDGRPLRDKKGPLRGSG